MAVGAYKSKTFQSRKAYVSGKLLVQVLEYLSDGVLSGNSLFLLI